MVDPINVAVNIAIISSFYALVAIGFTLIFSVGGILNFAHGSFITLGGFTAYIVSSELGYPIELGLLAAMVVAALAGLVIYRGLIHHIEDKPMTVLILTLVIGLFIQHSLRLYVTSSIITVPIGATATPLPLGGDFELAGITFQNSLLFVFFSSWAIIGALYLLVDRTRKGRAILALSMDARGATLVGIDRSRINLLTWVLAAAMAGFAGVLLTSFQTGQWNMGNEPLLISFAIVILGGVGSIKGSIVAAYIIGTIETLTVSIINPKLTGVSAFIILILAMLLLPEGLYGREAAE
jgi:branched-chain amino acid transport system permease protein